MKISQTPLTSHSQLKTVYFDSRLSLSALLKNPQCQEAAALYSEKVNEDPLQARILFTLDPQVQSVIQSLKASSSQ